MSVGIIIITHESIGAALFDTASMMIKNNSLTVKLVAVSPDCDPDSVLKTTNSLLDELDKGDGVLVLTDLIGSTPYNIAHRLHGRGDVNIVTGINLSMLIRLFNYPDLNLADLTEKALSGGIDGVSIVYGEKNNE